MYKVQLWALPWIVLGIFRAVRPVFQRDGSVCLELWPVFQRDGFEFLELWQVFQRDGFVLELWKVFQ